MVKINTGQVGVGGPGTNIDPLQRMQQQGSAPGGIPSQGEPSGASRVAQLTAQLESLSPQDDMYQVIVDEIMMLQGQGVFSNNNNTPVEDPSSVFSEPSNRAPAPAPTNVPVYTGYGAEKIDKLRGVEGFEEEVSAFDTYQEQLAQYQRESIQPLRNPPPSVPNKTFPLGNKPQTQVGQNFLAENIRTPDGGYESIEGQVARQRLERSRANAAATQNNLGARLENSKQLKGYFSSTYNFQKPEVDDLTQQVLNSGLQLNDLEMVIKTSPLDPGRALNVMEHFKEKYSATEMETALFVEDTYLGASKILLSLQKNIEVDENGLEYLDLGGDELGDSTFQTTNGLTAVEKGAFENFLAANFNGRMVEATQQPNSPDEPMGRALGRAGINKGYFEYVEDYQPMDAEGVPKGPTVSGYAMTADLKMQNRKYRDYAELSPIRIGAVSATNNSRASMGSLSLFQKRDTPRPKGDLSKLLKSSTIASMFTNFTSTLSNAFRIHSNTVLQSDAGFISDAMAYDNAYMNNEEITPTMNMLNEAAEKFYKLKTWTGADLNSNDPNIVNQEKKTILESRSRKLKLMANQVADAANLNIQLPNGHKVGGGVFVDPSAMRNYVYAYNSSEQNSTIMRGSLRGYASATRTRRMRDTKPNAPLITSQELNNLRNATLLGNEITADNREVLFLLMLGREMANVDGQSGRTRTDKQLLPLITPTFVRDIALKGSAIREYSNLNKDPKKLTNAIESSSIASSLGPEQNNALQGALYAMKASPKHHGAVQQMLEAADTYVNAESSSALITFNVFPDMSSAGRLNAIFNSDGALGAQIISRMGYYLSTEYSGGDNGHNHALPSLGPEAGTFPVGNPRIYVADAVVHALHISANEGNIDSQLSVFLKDLFSKPQGASLADTFLKLPAMVVDYGMAISGAGKVAAALFPKLLKEADALGYNATANVEAMLKANNVTMSELKNNIGMATSEALGKVANPTYSKAFQKLGLALGVLNKAPVYVGYDGTIHQVGQRERKSIFGSSVTISDKEGFSSSSLMQEENLSDSPGKRVEPKSRRVDGHWEFSSPTVYSAQAQAWSPAVGHYTERAIISKALEIYEKRFGKLDNNILDGHDSIGMDFAESYHFQNILQEEAIWEILEQDLPKLAAKASVDIMRAEFGKIKKKDKITLGPNSEYSHVTNYLDDLYNELKTFQTNMPFATPKQNQNRDNAFKNNLKILKDANLVNIWSPKDSTADISPEIASVSFSRKSSADSSSFQVNGMDFAAWYKFSFLDPAFSAAKEFVNVAPTLRKALIKAAKKAPDPAFFRNGPDTPASQ